MTIIGKQNRTPSCDEYYSNHNLDNSNIPKHIAFIMDGNGRWANSKNKPRLLGHKAGVNTVKEMIKESILLNIHYLSFYAFSTENWRRPKTEVTGLMKLLEITIKKELIPLKKEGIRIKCLGNLAALPKNLQTQIKKAEEETKDNSVIQINFLINYGSREEIVHACKKALQEKLDDKTLTEDTFQNNLYTNNIPDPDILIRTSNVHRISNFLLWQLSYTELFFEKELWPDFSRRNLRDVLSNFQKRNRRYGGL